jgi:putative multiple sugar transport system permease protein
MIIFIAALAVLFQWASDGLFLTPMNVSNLVFQGAYLIVLAPAMLMVLATGRLDLSVGGVVAFSGAVLAVLLLEWNVPALVSIPTVLLVGAAIGAFHGYLIAVLRIPMFIATLSGMLIWRGLTMVILKGETKAPLPSYLTEVATEFLAPGWALALAAGLSLVLIVRHATQVGAWIRRPGPLAGTVMMIVTGVLLMFHRGVPLPALVVSIPAIATWFLLERTIFGRHLYAFGAAPETAHLSGVRTRRVLLLVYLNNGFMAALAGLIVAGRLNAVTPKAGTLFELDAITACLLGGASMVGGVGRIGPVLLGAILIGVLNNGLSLTGIGNGALIKAAIMLAAGYADTILSRDGARIHSRVH